MGKKRLVLRFAAKQPREYRCRASREDGQTLDVSQELAPTVGEGEWLLVVGPHIVTATRGGGDGYRGTDTYARLDGAEDVIVIPKLPLPPPPSKPLYPFIVEIALAFAIVVWTGFAYTASLWALG
jgi:hypothetical protein